MMAHKEGAIGKAHLFDTDSVELPPPKASSAQQLPWLLPPTRSPLPPTARCSLHNK